MRVAWVGIVVVRVVDRTMGWEVVERALGLYGCSLDSMG
jgi:hypothetical protein